jgi:hypothetical protein
MERSPSHKVKCFERILLGSERDKPAIADVRANSRHSGAALTLENALHLLRKLKLQLKNWREGRNGGDLGQDREKDWRRRTSTLVEEGMSRRMRVLR